MARNRARWMLLWRRKLLYLLPTYQFYLLPVAFLVDCVLHWLYRTSDAVVIDGILVANLSVEQDEKSRLFAGYVRDALALIREVSPVLYRRVQKNLRYIVNNAVASRAQYRRLVAACEIDFSLYNVDKYPDDRAWYAAANASAIVHESTHGAMFARYIPYTRANRVRIERICINRENYFVGLLPPSKYDYTVNLTKTITDAELSVWLK